MSTPPKRGAPRKPPPEFSVPGTNFTVDWHCKTFPNYVHSFISHAHEDHMAGIRSFQPPRVLHCTEVTAKMLLIKVPKIQPCIKICEMNSTFTVEGVKIHVLNANHTPGSAMFIFELKNGKKILHTGDFRAEDFVVDSIRKFSPIDYLFIDCTYACQGINFPKRKECTDFVIDRIRELFPKGYFAIIGTYSIGKESLIFDAAEATANTIYAPEPRMRTLRDLTSTGWYKSTLLNDDKDVARIHVLSIGNGATLDSSIEYAKSLNKKKVVVFSLSGWNGRAFWQAPKIMDADGVKSVLYDVPFSDHSSPDELIQFVKVASPSKIIPTTSATPKLLTKINKMFYPFIRKEKNKQFLDFYFKPSSPKTSNYQSESQNTFELNSQAESQNTFELNSQAESQNTFELNSQTESQNTFELNSQVESQNLFELNSQVESQNSFEINSQNESQNILNPSLTNLPDADDSQCFLPHLNENNTKPSSAKLTPVRIDNSNANDLNLKFNRKFLSSDTDVDDLLF